MAIQTYSLKLDGDNQLSANFKVSEFACKDGSDIVLVCDALLALLQKIRDHFGAPITITSAYRTEMHNRAVGGASNSQHRLGTAADIVVSGVTPLVVAQYAEHLGAGGIGWYPSGQGNFTHVDTRSGRYWWQQTSSGEKSMSTFGGQDQFMEVKDEMAIEKRPFLITGQQREIKAGLVDGQNYPNLRDMGEVLGLDIGYDGVKQMPIVDFVKQEILVDGKPVGMKTMNVLGTTMVPLRDIAALFGRDVNYDGGAKRISVTTK